MRRPLIPPGIVGLDLSLTCAAAVYLPPDWVPGDWDTVKVMTAGYGVAGNDPGDRIKRLSLIASAITEFVRVHLDPGLHAHRRVFVEDYAYGMAGKSGMALGELGGAVKTQIWDRCNLTTVPVNNMTARKYFLGKLPRKGAAMEVHRVLGELGWPHAKTADPGDALIVANFGRSECGLPGLSAGT